MIITTLTRMVSRFVGDEEGQGLVEYSLLLVFVSLVGLVAVQFLGSDLSSAFSSIASTL